MPDFRIVKFRGKYAVSIVEDGKRKRLSLGTDDLNVARAKAAEFVRLRKAFSQHGKPLTMEAVYSAYVSDREAAGKASVSRMRDAWKRLGVKFGALNPISVTAELCREYAGERRRANVGNGTIHTELTYLRAALSYAEKQDWITKAPHIPLPSKPAPKEHHLTQAEAKAFIAAIVRPHVRLFAILALMTAGRPASILDLTWDRVDFKNREIDLRDPKRDATPKGRARVPMNDTAYKALKEAQAGAMTSYVIEYAGQPVVSIKKGVEAASRRSGVKVTPYVLRHTAAVWMVQNGVPIPEIAQYLGHTNPAVTYRVYARYSPQHLQKAAKSLDLDLD